MSILIPNLQARRHLIALQQLQHDPRRRLRRPDLATMIARMGFVQVDSINTVERAHHHILFARSQAYRQRDLALLAERDRALFENWTHDASMIPTAFFPYWRHRFEREKVRFATRWRSVVGAEGFADDLDRVLRRIADEGPVMTRDFEGDKPSTGWWDWHPSKAALEYLWRTGELAIARREGFQKVYDLTERVIPPADLGRRVDFDAFVDWACREALERLGFAKRGEIAAFWALLSPAEVDRWLHDNRDGLALVRVEGAGRGDARHAFALPGHVDAALAAAPAPQRLRILSPFDPLLRDRARAERLFGFHYRIEVFVPEAKRRYGYYVFPVLRGERMVGRIDARADRGADTLSVTAFWPEAGVRRSAALVAALEAELHRIRRLAGVENVAFAPDWFRPAGSPPETSAPAP
jgi:uncharacterized protein YcaQ